MTGYMLRARILARMAELRMTDQGLASRLGWPVHEIRTRILGGRGALTVSEVTAIARVLEVPIGELTGGAWYGCATCGAVGEQPAHNPGCTQTGRNGAEELLPAVPR